MTIALREGTNIPAWTFRDVRFSYPNASRCTVDSISIEIGRGEMTALLGPNGAGKSTLLHLMLATLKPESGEITFDGRPLVSYGRSTLARKIGVVPQGETEPLFTVREIVAMGRYPHLGPWQREGKSDTDAIAAAMERCSVTRFADRWFGTLSGGERQRVRLARALAQKPAILVLDEPTASLDVRHEMTTFELLSELRDEGVTVVIVTHNLNLAARYADDLVLLNNGRVVAHGTAQDVLTADRVGEVYEWPVAITQYEDGRPQVVPRASHDARLPNSNGVGSTTYSTERL
jgi:iron complex transport system ATP-binding protein